MTSRDQRCEIDTGVEETRSRRARVWRPSATPGIELLKARYFEQSFPPHSHRRYSIGVVESGFQEIIYGGQRHRCGPGDVGIFAPHVVHSARIGSAEPVVLRVAFVEPSILQAFHANRDRLLHFSRPVVFDPKLATLFRCAHRDLEEPSAIDLGRYDRFVEVLKKIVERHCLGAGGTCETSSEVASAEEDCLVQWLRWLDRPDEPDVKVEELARRSGLSRFQLNRRFRSKLQMTPQGYLMQQRVRRAKELLRRGVPIAEAALASGFSDQSHLTRVFRRWVGVTPSSFR